MTPPRLFLDSCVLIEGLLSPWSSSRGLLILGRASFFRFVLAEIVIEETERALMRKLERHYAGKRTPKDDLALLLQRMRVERVPHISREEFERARTLIRHRNDVPVIAAAVKSKPDWLLTTNTVHFNETVAKRTGLKILTPVQLLDHVGALLEGRPGPP